MKPMLIPRLQFFIIGPLVAALLAGVLTSAPVLAEGFIPADGCYLGAYIELDCATGGDIDDFESIIGRPHASYFRYVGYGSPFPFRWVREMHERGILPHIAWEPNNGLDPVRDDDYLRGWAEAAARTGGPVFLRYASEMNGTWQAYSGNPAEFIEKWRSVARVMREIAPNVIMVWCPFATPQRTITEYYPGDEWVDWVGVNIYSVHHYDGDITKPAVDDPREQLRYVYDLYADRKPIAICEYAATHFCAACNSDVTDFGLQQMTRLYEALPTQFPRVKMIAWFCVDTVGTGLASNNYSLTASREFAERYRELVGDSYFLGRLPESSRMIASMPRTTPAPVVPTPAPVPFGPLEIPAVEPPPEQPEEQPTGPLPPTDHPLALARLGPVSPSQIDIAVIGAPPSAVRGEVEIVAEAGEDLNVEVVEFHIDGQWRAITNVTPFRFPWNASLVEPGVHTLTVVGMNSGSVPVHETTVSVIVVGEVGG